MEKGYKEKAGKNVMNFVKKFEKHGPRLPGSPEEAKAADALIKEVKQRTDINAVKEEFDIHPNSGVASIPYMGALAYISLFTYFLGLIPKLELIMGIVTVVLMTCLWVFAGAHIFRYKTWFDFLFKKSKSANIVAELPARSGKHDFTLVYSGHLDTSWNWNMAIWNPAMALPCTIIGIVGTLAFWIFSIIKLVGGFHFDEYVSMIIIPIILAFTFWPLCIYLSYNKKKASPGAMDNLTGTGLALEMLRHYKENPDAIPDDCRVVFVGMGAEEAGLRGSFAFVKKHFGKDDMAVPGKTYVINIDSIADKDNFEVVQGDIWQTTFFNKDMCNMAFDVMDEMGLKPARIYNPLGGCDSTPFHKKGIDTITLAAQNPVSTSYYHTYNDVSSRFGEGVLADGFEVLTRFTDKVIAYHRQGGSKKA